MQHEIFKKSLLITDAEDTFEDIYQKEYIPAEYIDDIKKANCLFIPDENFRGEGETLFPETTRQLFDYFKENEQENLITDIAVSDEGFKKIELHSATINIATMIVEYGVLPIVTGLISAFLYDLVKKYHRKKEDTTANVKLIVQETKRKKSKKIIYRGPVEGIEEALNSSIKDMFKDE